RHTRFSRDWSSDVCSSALAVLGRRLVEPACAPEFELVVLAPNRLVLPQVFPKPGYGGLLRRANLGGRRHRPQARRREPAGDPVVTPRLDRPYLYPDVGGAVPAPTMRCPR